MHSKIIHLAVLSAALPCLGVDGEYLHSLYDKLHDSPMQRRIREAAPMPFGVVFLPWEGMTEAELREQFRTMKKLGFHNLKGITSTPEWDSRRIMHIALDEDVIPFWYGDAGWEPITPALLARLGIPASLGKSQIRTHPKMLAYQKEVLRKQIDTYERRNSLGESGGYHHVPDPILREADVKLFSAWLRGKYKTLPELNRAWNLNETDHWPAPFQTWNDVDLALVEIANPSDGRSRSAWGREFGRIRDILRFKAESRVGNIREAVEAARQQNPLSPTRSGGEMGLFLPFAYRATNMEWIADLMKDYGSFYPSIHFVWHFGEVHYEVARALYMQVSFAADLLKGGWTGAWESSGGPQQLSGYKGWVEPEISTIPGFTVNAGTITQQFLSYIAGGFRGAGVWCWNYRNAGIEGGEYSLLERTRKPGARAVRAGMIARAAQGLRDELWQAHKEPLVGVLMNWDSDAIWAANSVRNRDLFRHYPMQARVGVSRALINGNIPWEHVTVDDLRAGLALRYKSIYLPAQLALTEELLALLTTYAQQGGRIILDAPGGWYDETGRILPVAQGSAFERLFGAEIIDFQYSNNVPRFLDGDKMSGFILELRPTSASILSRFQTGEPAVLEHRIGKGAAIVLAFDASHASFLPGNTRMEERIRQYALGPQQPSYRCDGAIVYRLAAPAADHYFFINDGPAVEVRLDFRGNSYRAVSDPVSGEKLTPGASIALEPYSGRWLRYEK